MREETLQQWARTKNNTQAAQSVINANIRTDRITKVDFCMFYYALDPLIGKIRLYNELDKLYEDELIIQLAELK